MGEASCGLIRHWNCSRGVRRHPLNKSPVMVSCIKAIKAREIYNDAFSGYDKLTQVSV